MINDDDNFVVMVLLADSYSVDYEEISEDVNEMVDARKIIQKPSLNLTDKDMHSNGGWFFSTGIDYQTFVRTKREEYGSCINSIAA